MFNKQRITQGLPLALAALLAACGGGNGSDSGAPGTVLKAESTAQTETALTPTGATASAVERGDLRCGGYRPQ